MRIFFKIAKEANGKVAGRKLALAVLGLCLLAWGWGNTPAAQAAEKVKVPQGVRELMQYKGADREKVLLAAAKKEGDFVLYAQLNLEDAYRLLGAFQKKYGISGKLYRAQGEDVLQKLLTEAQVGRIGGDAFELDSPFMTILRKEKLLTPFWSPHLDKYAPETKDPNGYWQSTRMTLDVLAYNTKKLPPLEVPHTYEDLLKPEYKGKLGMEAINADWFATLLKYWGEEKGKDYFKKLGGQSLHMRKGHSLLTDLTVAGEFPITVNAYNHKVEQYKSKGAAIEWVPLEPVVAILSGVAVPEKAKHPAAGILFCDFMLSKEGQEVLRDLKRVPASREVPADPPRLNRGFKFIPLFTESADDYGKWQKLYDDLIVLRGK